MRAQTLAMFLWAGIVTAAVAVPPLRPIEIESRIVVPLVDAPFEQLVDRTSTTRLDGDGAHARGWVTADAAWLVLDPDWRGELRSSDAMITNGFAALRALDANADGELTGAELSGLSLWRDENGNGVSEPGEVLPASVHGIAALRLEGLVTRPGLVTAPEGLRFEDGRTRPLYDWRAARPL